MVEQEDTFKAIVSWLKSSLKTVLKVEGNKRGIYYKASFLPGDSLIVSLLILSKLEVNDETRTVCQFWIYKRLIGDIYGKSQLK